MDEKLYLLKVKLLDIEPEIWRRFVVPADITLDRLHDVLQVVMGWSDAHIYEFTIGKKRYTEDPEGKEDGLEGGKYRLGDLVKQKGRSFEYCYDLGDDWRHEITVEDNQYDNPELEEEVECLDGARACPPEDIGGPPGYVEFCEVMKKPARKRHQALLQWYGGPYDPEAFAKEDANELLMIYLRWSRNRHLPWGDPLV